MVVWRRLFSRILIRQRESIKDLIPQQKVLSLGIRFEDCGTSLFDPLLQLVSFPFDHQLVKLRHGFCILSDLFLGRGIENSETGVDVPFVRIDPESDVDLDVLDSAYPTIDFPGKLIVGVPCSTHAQESSVRHSLGVGCDAVVHLPAKVDIL